MENEMVKGVDLTGRRFGRLVGDSRADNTDSGRSQWFCRCDCASESGSKSLFLARTDNLMSGKTTSCGCKKVGRPTQEAINNAVKNAPLLSNNEFMEKITIICYSGTLGIKGMRHTFAAARGEGITGYVLTRAIGRPNIPGPISVSLEHMMKLLVSMGIIAEQGKRSYSKWMEECGVVYREVDQGGVMDVNYQYDRIVKGEE